MTAFIVEKYSFTFNNTYESFRLSLTNTRTIRTQNNKIIQFRKGIFPYYCIKEN